MHLYIIIVLVVVRLLSMWLLWRYREVILRRWPATQRIYNLLPSGRGFLGRKRKP